MSRLPFPSNENSLSSTTPGQATGEPAWQRCHPNEGPPIMFQVQFYDGRIVSYAYSDLRETRLRDAGYLQLCIYGMEKYHVTVVGRHLTELANLIGLGRVKSLRERGPRTFAYSEASPSIDKITIETLTGPAF
jgi:hypothetical protein